MNAVTLHATGAAVTDEAALTALTRPVIEGKELRKVLQSGWIGRTQHYDAKGRKVYYVVSDGRYAECFIAAGINPAQATAISDACAAAKTKEFNSFKSVIENVVGKTK